MAAPMKDDVDLGFVEKVESWKLLSHLFPSKVGGNPSWLSLKPVPRSDMICCVRCNHPCVFLCQIYAPISTLERAFHRTLFLFVCKNPKCYSRNSALSFRVLRSQLSRVNDFYSSVPPNEEKFNWSQKFPSAWDYQNLCVVCGCQGPKKCAKCHSSSYCGREHQIVDWKSGHKGLCGSIDLNDRQLLHKPHTFLFPEFDLVTEPEDYTEKPEKSDTEKMKEYEKFIEKTGKDMPQFDKSSQKDLEEMAKHEKDEDTMFMNFKERISHEPEQVLRYDRCGEPLWVSNEGIPIDIPNCTCGAERQFEFQILPQMLLHLGVDSLEESIDWGTLIVYTCTDSCDIGNEYKEEFVCKQDFSSEDITKQ